MLRPFSLALLTAAVAAPVAAETLPSSGDTWVDEQHATVKDRLKVWSHHMDGWFGKPDPNQPASANLRIMMDTEWNKYDEFSVTPRIRGRLKLPVLEQKVNVIFGDDSLDDEFRHDVNGYRNRTYENGKNFDSKTSRDNNSSLALRWSDAFNNLEKHDIHTDFDIGIRSGNDIYVRAQAEKNWQLSDTVNTRLEQIYRYGVDSKHHVRTNWETRYASHPKIFMANQLYVQYEHDHTDDWTWGNSLYRQHNLGTARYINYGLYTGGSIENNQADLNSYGPFVNYRQPIWRNWLFAQTEFNYLNNRDKDRDHHIGALLRIEALF